MPERRLYTEWRRSTEATRYPFSERASLVNEEGIVLLEGTFLDAALTVIGAQAGLFLAQAVVDHDQVTLVLGDPQNANLASGSFKLVQPESVISFTDTFGRPAGVLVSESQRLGIFQSWGVGTHVFLPEQTEFAATVCFPTPEAGLRGILLDDGTLFTGDVWLIGDDGVVLRVEDVNLPAVCGLAARTVQVIRVDIVGDPLFRRRLCTPVNLFQTPQVLRRLRVIAPNISFECGPDAAGDIKLAVHNDLIADTVLRLNSTPDGLVIGAIGSETDKV